MADTFAFFAQGLENLDQLTASKDEIRRALSKAINTITRNARAEAARRIRDEVNLPARYLSPSQKRLFVAQQASPSNLEGVIRGRSRPTSLARFVQGTPQRGRGVYVEVAPGRARYMRRAFIIRLPGAGGSTDPELANKGLAIRLKPGERLTNKTDFRPFSSKDRNLYLLYGPSVDQVFNNRKGTGVANDMVPDIEVELEAEFLRLLDL